MNRAQFFAHLRRRDVPLFGSTLSQRQVDGIEALLDAGAGLPAHHMANVLAQVWRETGGGMYPVKETVMPHHKNKNPSDAEVIGRLDREWAKPGHGGLRHVRTPYWPDGWFGRGQIQITHKAMYDKFGITNPDDALRLDVSARIAVQGMRDGMFTGKKLSDYVFPDALDAPPRQNPRRIVNGVDGSDAAVAEAHRHFYAALIAGGWQEQSKAQAPASAPEQPADATPGKWLAGFFDDMMALWSRLRGKQ